MADTQSRKWQLTINNPIDLGFTHDYIKEQVHKFKSIEYWCMSDETGEEGTFHTHVYLKFKSAVRFSSLFKRFKRAHIENCKGTNQQNKDYVFKEGKWETSEKGSTNHRESHFEYGTMPIEQQGARNDLEALYDMIRQGMSDIEIMEVNPAFMSYLDTIGKVRQKYREEQFKDMFRNLEVVYIHGATGTGKTRRIMEKYGYAECYRITDYKNPWDSYKGQDVVIFEEFRSSMKIQEMLNLLDGYPCELRSRYFNKVACYTKVYIITNYELIDQYTDIQHHHRSTWDAFCRRITRIEHQLSSTFITEQSVRQYFNKGEVDVFTDSDLMEKSVNMLYDN